MIVLILPAIENDNFLEKFDKITNVYKLKLCKDPTKQACIDGVWEWEIKTKTVKREKYDEVTKKPIKDEFGNNVTEEMEENYTVEKRTMKKIKIDPQTQLESDSPDAIEVNDWVSVDSVEFKIHPKSKITMKDIEIQKNKTHVNFGNGFSSSFSINDKICSIIVLEKGEVIDDEIFDKIGKDFAKI